MFIGRERELNTLDNLYKSNKLGFVFAYQIVFPSPIKMLLIFSFISASDKP